MDVVEPIHLFGKGKDKVVESSRLELGLSLVNVIREMDGLNGFVGVEDTQAHAHFTVVEVDDLGYPAGMHVLLSRVPADVAHVMVVDFNGLLAVVQTEHYLEVVGVVDLLDTVVVQQKVLLFLLRELDVELGIGLLFLDYYHLAHHILEDLLVGHGILAILRDLPKHIL